LVRRFGAAGAAFPGELLCNFLPAHRDLNLAGRSVPKDAKSFLVGLLTDCVRAAYGCGKKSVVRELAK
jgi:hypothetical protein